MKKLVTIVIAVMIMAFSSLSAFALSVDSPIASTEPETQASTSVKTPDNNNTSPKTGSNDFLAYALIAVSFVPYLSYLRCKKTYSEFLFEQIQVYTSNTIICCL